MSDNENYSSDENDSDNETEILSEKEDSDNEEQVNVTIPKKEEDKDKDEDKDDSDYENNELENDEENDEVDEVDEESVNGELVDEEESVNGELVDEEETAKKGNEKSTTTKSQIQLETNSDDEDDDDDTPYLQKFNSEINKNYIMEHHPECVINNYDEITSLTTVIRDKNNNIIDDLHRTLPYLTKYERARILGQRSKQINSGAKVFVKVRENIIDGYLIAQMELEQKRIPFIIKRPIPGGGCEYWNLKDLEIVGF